VDGEVTAASRRSDAAVSVETLCKEDDKHSKQHRHASEPSSDPQQYGRKPPPRGPEARDAARGDRRNDNAENLAERNTAAGIEIVSDVAYRVERHGAKRKHD
jgi:hypothetical protein